MYCQLSSNNNNETVVRIRSHFSRFVDGSGCARVRRRGGSLRLAGPFGSSRLAGGSRRRGGGADLFLKRRLQSTVNRAKSSGYGALLDRE
jgi:hypothetical protein